MLPQHPFLRLAVCGGLVVAAPWFAAILSASAMVALAFHNSILVWRYEPLFVIVGAVIAVVGSSAAALPLPVRWAMRIGAAAACALIGFLGFAYVFDGLTSFAYAAGLLG